MPAPLDVNREAVRVLATAVGVREAARQMGLGESVVQQWSAREGWFKAAPAVIQPPTVQKQTVSSVTKPAAALSNAMESLNGKTRIVQARTVLKGSRGLSKLAPAQIIANAGQLKSLVDSADKLHGWSRDQSSPALVNITIGPAVTAPAPVIIDLP